MDLQTLRKQYKKQIIKTLNYYNIPEVKIFGSVVRGEWHSDSDVDMLIGTGKGLGLRIVKLEQELLSSC